LYHNGLFLSSISPHFPHDPHKMRVQKLSGNRDFLYFPNAVQKWENRRMLISVQRLLTGYKFLK